MYIHTVVKRDREVYGPWVNNVLEMKKKEIGSHLALQGRSSGVLLGLHEHFACLVAICLSSASLAHFKRKKGSRSRCTVNSKEREEK